MCEECQSSINNETFPINIFAFQKKKTINYKWIYALKTKFDGNID